MQYQFITLIAKAAFVCLIILLPFIFQWLSTRSKYDKLLKKHVKLLNDLKCFGEIEKAHCEQHNLYIGQSLKNTVRNEVLVCHGLKLSRAASPKLLNWRIAKCEEEIAKRGQFFSKFNLINGLLK